ncbi:methionyl aminopeptidase [Candidatus Clavichlamydia salmonicola]|uniref:methionyl aminopeptidase n=1 Tax=Candidatus Clavichlamydia salmonicola TaxID=469812 RepID=UPI00189185E8|nr:methionyl aminopeptidase [Candidatus Clavichlamydia salmonicola]
MKRNDPCWCSSHKKWKKCHFPLLPPDEKSRNSLEKSYLQRYGIILKTPEQIEKIRAACQLTRRILEELCATAVENVTTNDLDRLSQQLHADAGAIPAPLGYGSPPFPKSICTSLNDMICHGIPNDIPLKNGDILNIDASAILNGFFGDCSNMVIIGEVSEEKRLVCEAAQKSLENSIKILSPGIPISSIGNTIEETVTAYGFSSVHQFVGHGVGCKFHENPTILHYSNQDQTILVPGMTFTIEPMINVGAADAVIDNFNKWEARTIDGKPSAQWEHTVLITETGYEILTLP